MFAARWVPEHRETVQTQQFCQGHWSQGGCWSRTWETAVGWSDGVPDVLYLNVSGWVENIIIRVILTHLLTIQWFNGLDTSGQFPFCNLASNILLSCSIVPITVLWNIIDHDLPVSHQADNSISVDLSDSEWLLIDQCCCYQQQMLIMFMLQDSAMSGDFPSQHTRTEAVLSSFPTSVSLCS